MSGHRIAPQNLFILAVCALGVLMLVLAGLRSDNEIDAPVIPATDEPIAAMINDRPILEVDVAMAREQLRGEEEEPPNRETILQTLIDQRLLADHAKRIGLSEDRLTQARIRLAEEQVLAEALLNTTGQDAVSEAVLQRLYEEQAALRQRGVEIRARQILLPDRETADEVIKKLERGDTFPALAVAYSLDRVSRESGGDLGFFTRDSYPTEFADPVFATSVGEQTPLFETSRGWHIVEVTDRRRAPTPAFEDMRGELETFLRAEAIEKLLSELKAKAEIDILNTTPDPQDEP